MLHCCAYQQKSEEALIQPPMPTTSPSARASAAATQRRTGDWRKDTTRAWPKHACSQRRQVRLSLAGCVSRLAGSWTRTQVSRCARDMNGMSVLAATAWPATLRTLPPRGSQRPAGERATTASGVSEVLPHVWAHRAQRTALAAQVLVQRSHIRAELWARGSGPHEKSQELFQSLARDFLSASNFKELLLTLGELVWN